MAVLAAGGLCKSFGRRRVLAGLDLDVAPGELVAVVGENGTGKTTLLRILAGDLRPDAGTAVPAAGPPRSTRPTAGRCTAPRAAPAPAAVIAVQHSGAGGPPSAICSRSLSGTRPAGYSLWSRPLTRTSIVVT
jgi:energy-coupling factor transporter ATP-binding protein EcfA2